MEILIKKKCENCKSCIMPGYTRWEVKGEFGPIEADPCPNCNQKGWIAEPISLRQLKNELDKLNVGRDKCQ